MTALASAPHAVNHERKSQETNGFRPDIQGLWAIAVGMARYWTSLEKHPTELARCDVPRSTAIPRNSPVSYAATLMRGNVAVVDANSLICGPEVRAPVVGNILVYSDRHRLTWYYSKSTAQFIEPLLLRANKILADEPS